MPWPIIAGAAKAATGGILGKILGGAGKAILGGAFTGLGKRSDRLFAGHEAAYSNATPAGYLQSESQRYGRELQSNQIASQGQGIASQIALGHKQIESTERQTAARLGFEYYRLDKMLSSDGDPANGQHPEGNMWQQGAATMYNQSPSVNWLTRRAPLPRVPRGGIKDIGVTRHGRHYGTNW